jgi:hypothetical protein
MNTMLLDEEQKPIDLPTYADGEIDHILMRRVCARCFGHLVKSEAPGRMWYALCPECGEAWHGAHISKRTAERMAEKAKLEYWEVRYSPALQDILPKQEKRTVKKLLEDLGF